MNRRSFLSCSALTGTGLLILPSGALANPANNRLNIALIGVSGRGLSHYGWLKEHNVVALCDINEAFFAEALKTFAGAATYTDWRKCLDHKGLDAVVICTADHHHAFISNWALNRGLHVYCEKPLAISVEEARVVCANWLTKKGKLATQVGTQMHAQENYSRMREMIRDGAIGDLESATAFGNRQIRRKAYHPASGSPPQGLHWDLWLGPSPERPFNPAYFVGRPGANCLEWNMFWDYGVGQIGDMGSHMMDMVWNVVDATLPLSIQAKGEAFNPDVTPVEMESHFDHPANAWRGPVRVSWHQGGKMPRSPAPGIDLTAIGHGVIFKGSRGFLVTDYQKRILLPYGKDADLTYYRPRAKQEQEPPISAFHQNWIDACKDPSKSTCCDFEYGANMIEQMLLGLVAYRVGKKLEYDGATGKITNAPEANEFVSRKYRDGWTLNG
jgi:predicted dehydrogenase